MILNLPYALRITCVPPGRTKASTFDVRDSRPFEVPEATSSEAPESCRYLHVPHRSWGGRSYVPLHVSLEDLGTQVAAFPESGTWRNRPQNLLVDAFSGAAVEAAVPFTLPRREDKLAEVVRQARRGREVKELTDDAAAAAALAGAAWARRLLVVDGEPWIAAPEPRYNLNIRYTTVVLETGTGPGKEDTRWTIPFRADRREEAVAYGRLVASRTKGRAFRDDVHPTQDIELSSAEHLTLDEAEVMAAWILDRTADGDWNQCRWVGPRKVAEAPTGADRHDDDAVRAKRRADNRTWAWDLLDLPDLAARAEQAHRGFAHERTAHGVGTKVLHAAWTEVVRPRIAALAQAVDDDLSDFDPDPRTHEQFADFAP